MEIISKSCASGGWGLAMSQKLKGYLKKLGIPNWKRRSFPLLHSSVACDVQCLDHEE